MAVSYRPVWATNQTKHQLFQEKCGQCGHGREGPLSPVQSLKTLAPYSLWLLPSFTDSAPSLALPLFPWLLPFPFSPFSA